MMRLNPDGRFPHLCHGVGCAVCYWILRMQAKLFTTKA